MALENIAVSISDLVIGFLVLIIGCVIAAFSPQFPSGLSLLGKIAGIIIAIIGIFIIILAFI